MYESSVFVEIPGRLARILLELGDKHGEETDAGLLIDLKLSQYDLGTLIGASRESVNKLLKTWEGQVIVEVQSGKVTLTNLPVLEALT